METEIKPLDGTIGNMGVNVLEELLSGLRSVLTQYEKQESELRHALTEVVQNKLMQAGAIRGVEMAIEKLAASAPQGD